MCNLSATALINIVTYVVLVTGIHCRAFLSRPPALTCRFLSLFVLLARYLDVEWVKQVLASIVEHLPECTYTALNHCNYAWVCLSSHATQYTQCANGVLMFPHLVQIRPFFLKDMNKLSEPHAGTLQRTENDFWSSVSKQSCIWYLYILFMVSCI